MRKKWGRISDTNTPRSITSDHGDATGLSWRTRAAKLNACDDVQAFLDASFAPWVLDLRPTVTQANAQGVTIDIPITQAIARVGGIVSGQALATLADTCMVLSVGAHLGKMVPVATVTLDTQFLRPALGDGIRAQAVVTRAGRSLAFARCTLTAWPDTKVAALATATFALPV
ncbi:PaaI family thioesterase [uncultured Tateyamaria sp.]|uniref:PaaI family thioesterase n=1 Tax=uncultured Tateyamaria sp. TaxID=455651 RepID=UPI002621AFA6|nr:PaaI family thioesterase [uncultured Tateyamaria sp.]